MNLVLNAQHPLQFTNLLERIAQLGCRQHCFTSTDRREATVLILLPMATLIELRL